MRKTTRDRSAYVYLGAFGIAIFLISSYLSTYIGKSTIYLLFVFIVTLMAWIAGFQFAMLTSIIAGVAAVNFFLLPPQPQINQMQTITEVIVFLWASIFLSFIIEKYKKTDITIQHRTELADITKKITTLTADNQKMQQEIKLRDEFLSITSHELKTPLTSMLLKLQTALHSVRNVSLAHFSVKNLLDMLDTAEQQSKRLSRMINDLLNVSLITTGKLNLELDSVDITAVVKEVAHEFAEKLEKGGYTLTLTATQPVTAFVDKLRIEQVITNLISNAIKYGDNKPIEVNVTKHGAKAEIVVRDHGIGINRNNQDKIFSLFERANVASKYKGLGVGLYIASQIVKEHGGTIKVKSQSNIGTTFTVELPLTQPLRLK